MKSNRGFEFSFSWLFAIIAGAVIIFLAVYATTRLIGTERKIEDTELAKELGIILNPLETSLESGKTSKITLPARTRLFNECESDLSAGTFGVQKISIATKSSVGKEWDKPGEASSFRNKYLFSDSIVEGDSYGIFVKPLFMPFKIADLIYLFDIKEGYCFVNPPKEIEDEINEIQLANMKVSSSVSECSESDKKVCFTSAGCDVDVSIESSGKIRGSVKKKFSDIVYFESSALLYGAIFADPNIYECQIKRLMKRASELAWLYRAKSVFLTPKGCSSDLESELLEYANKTHDIDSSIEIREIVIKSEEINRRNNDLSCKLF